MKAELVPENGDPPIPISRDVTVIGRREYCDVSIPDASLSKRHCILVKTDGLLVIRDLVTTNGTKVKGQRIRWAALLPDDRIALGAYKLRVYLGPDDAPAPSEMAKWSGAKKKGSATGPKARPAAPNSSSSTARPSPAPAPAEFAAPSPLGTPSVAPVGYWQPDDPNLALDDVELDVDVARWPDLDPPIIEPDDDVLIELD